MPTRRLSHFSPEFAIDRGPMRFSLLVGPSLHLSIPLVSYFAYLATLGLAQTVTVQENAFDFVSGLDLAVLIWLLWCSRVLR